MSRILLVSENPLTAKMLRTWLSQRGHSLSEINDPHDLVLPQLSPLLDVPEADLVLYDLSVRDPAPLAFATQLREHFGPALPVLALTGLAREDEAQLSSVFSDTITKPLDRARVMQTIESHLAATPSNAERFGLGKRMLLADDDPLQLKLMRFRLERLGFEVTVARDGLEALQLALRLQPDVLVSDVMMPELDGFKLSLAIRTEPTLATVPIILVTSSYSEVLDQKLARGVGADALVSHSPDFKNLIDKLQQVLRDPLHPAVLGSIGLDELEHAHELRVERQLERQVAQNAQLRRRCSALAAELRVLAGISEDVLKQRDLDSVLDDALLACFDAVDFSHGALYLFDAEQQFRVRALGLTSRWAIEKLRDFFGHEAWLRQLIAARNTTLLRKNTAAEQLSAEVLQSCGVETLLIVPLMTRERTLGALVMAGQGYGVETDDLITFGAGLGAQISQVLALANAFEEETHARDRAEQQAALLSALLLHAPDAVAHLDPSSHVLFVNHVMREAHPELSVGSNWLRLQAPEQRAAARHAFDAALSTGKSAGYEVLVPGPDGAMRWYENRLGPIRRADEITGVMLIARDITDKRQSEAQLHVSDRMASVGLLAASVAHEINNPLAALMIHLELMARELARDASQVSTQRLLGELEGAREGGRRITQVARDLKIYARSNEQQRHIQVVTVIESSLRMAWNEIRHRARLIRNFAEVPAVLADESRLGQVFLNLILNAAQAIPEGNAEKNEVRVSVEPSVDGGVVISIADTGCGIPEANKARLFRPFFTTKAEGVGTGLGLSICDRIVRSMGGTITFDSEVGKGATFRVTLLSAGDVAVQPEGVTAKLTRPSRRGQVLVVEDDRLVGDVVRRFLGHDHDVSVAKSGFEALQLVTREPRFDVILCDLMMPQMTGEELWNEVRRFSPRQAERIVFMTGGPFTPGAREFLGSVSNRRIDKPFDLQSLQKLFIELVN
jgi:PAS domain S-box-containing protein